MSQVHVIRHKYFVEEEKKRAIARELGVSRNTVRKYLEVSEPVRREVTERARPVIERIGPRIDELLDEWRGRTTAKQRITATRLWRQLIEEGDEVSERTVQRYLREKKRQAAEVYIPLVHRAGDAAQVDFFDVTVDENGIRRKAWKFVVRLMCSKKDFAWIYDRCDQLSFFDGHVRAFEHFGGVPSRLIYDNLTAAVKKVIFPNRDLTDRFKALASYYLFEPCFARPGEGHDKGGVEARGKGIRLAHLTPIPIGSTLREISEQLLIDMEKLYSTKKTEEGRLLTELFAEEHPKLRPLPDFPFEARKALTVSITSRSLVRIEGATYSVPSRWAKLDATALVGVEDIKILCMGEEVVRTKLSKGKKDIRYRDYMPELARKPQAVRQVAPELIEELGGPFGKFWEVLIATYGEKEAARILSKVIGAITERGEEEVRGALEKALKEKRFDLLFLPRKDEIKKISVPEPLSGYVVDAARASDYNHLLAGGVS